MGIKRVTVQTSEKDFRESTRILSAPICNSQSYILMISIAISVITLGFISDYINESEVLDDFVKSWSCLIIPVIFLIQFICTFYFLMRYANIQYLDEKGSFLRPHKISIDAKGIDSESKYSRGFIDWRAVIEITDNNEFLLIYLDKMVALVIPKRCFKSPEDAADFLIQARTYWNAAIKEPKTNDAKEREVDSSPWQSSSICPRVPMVLREKQQVIVLDDKSKADATKDDEKPEKKKPAAKKKPSANKNKKTSVTKTATTKKKTTSKKAPKSDDDGGES